MPCSPRASLAAHINARDMARLVAWIRILYQQMLAQRKTSVQIQQRINLLQVTKEEKQEKIIDKHSSFKSVLAKWKSIIGENTADEKSLSSSDSVSIETAADMPAIAEKLELIEKILVQQDSGIEVQTAPQSNQSSVAVSLSEVTVTLDDEIAPAEVRVDTPVEAPEISIENTDSVPTTTTAANVLRTKYDNRNYFGPPKHYITKPTAPIILRYKREKRDIKQDISYPMPLLFPGEVPCPRYEPRLVEKKNEKNAANLRKMVEKHMKKEQKKAKKDVSKLLRDEKPKKLHRKNTWNHDESILQRIKNKLTKKSSSVQEIFGLPREMPEIKTCAAIRTVQICRKE